MKYPRLPRKLDRRCKLMDKDIRTIRTLYKYGASIKTLAKKFKVSGNLIRYWTDEKYRQCVIECAKKHHKQDKETQKTESLKHTA